MLRVMLLQLLKNMVRLLLRRVTGLASVMENVNRVQKPPRPGPVQIWFFKEHIFVLQYTKFLYCV
jgi:hypothetical protein